MGCPITPRGMFSSYLSYTGRWAQHDRLNNIYKCTIHIHNNRYNPNYGIFRLAFLYVPAWGIIIFLAIAMGFIYRHILKQERKLDKYAASLAGKKRDKSRRIRNQVKTFCLL